MLARFIKKFGHIYHVHSRTPPEYLTHIGGNVYHEWFNNIKIDKNMIRKYKIIYLFRNPTEAQLSIFLCDVVNPKSNSKDVKVDPKSHSKNIQVEKWDEIISLENYINKNIDLLNYNEFFDNYMKKNINRNYDIIGLNYHKLWDDLPKVFKILKLSKKEIASFPKKIETKRDTNPFIVEKLNRMNYSLIEKIEKMKSISIKHKSERKNFFMRKKKQKKTKI